MPPPFDFEVKTVKAESSIEDWSDINGNFWLDYRKNENASKYAERLEDGRLNLTTTGYGSSTWAGCGLTSKYNVSIPVELMFTFSVSSSFLSEIGSMVEFGLTDQNTTTYYLGDTGIVNSVHIKFSQYGAEAGKLRQYVGRIRDSTSQLNELSQVDGSNSISVKYRIYIATLEVWLNDTHVGTYETGTEHYLGWYPKVAKEVRLVINILKRDGGNGVSVFVSPITITPIVSSISPPYTYMGNWIKENIIIESSGKVINDPTIVRLANGTYYLWYSGTESNLTKSDNLETWTNVQAVSGLGTKRCVVRLENETYIMYYQYNWKFYAKHSTDLLSWSEGTLILSNDTDEPRMQAPEILRNWNDVPIKWYGKYRMFYYSQSETDPIGKVYMAESDDLINWVKRGVILSPNSTTYPPMQTFAGVVPIYLFDKVLLIVNGGTGKPTQPDQEIGLWCNILVWSSSSQLTTWTQYQNLILEPSLPFENVTRVYTGDYVFKDGKLYFIYNARDTNGVERIGLAYTTFVFPNAVDWTTNESNRKDGNPFIVYSSYNVSSLDFANQRLTATITTPSGATSTTQVYCGDYGKPSSVSGASSWSYDSGTKILTVTAEHSSDVIIEVSWVPSTLTQAIRSNFFFAVGLLSLAPILFATAVIVGLLRQREELDVATLAGSIVLCAVLIIGAIVMIIILNAFIGL